MSDLITPRIIDAARARLSKTLVRYVNFYPPIDAAQDPHPWRTTSWVSEELARRHARPGALAVAVRVEFAALGGSNHERS